MEDIYQGNSDRMSREKKSHESRGEFCSWPLQKQIMNDFERGETLKAKICSLFICGYMQVFTWLEIMCKLSIFIVHNFYQ